MSGRRHAPNPKSASVAFAGAEPGSATPGRAAAGWLDDPFGSWPQGWCWILVFAAALTAYLPALGAGFIWDDAGHVTRPELRSLDGLVRIWFEPGATQQYYPLLHTAFWLEHLVLGDSPAGYHLVNILLHATAAGLFATLLRRLAFPGAWLAALVFALHPVMVESVAWISEQKNTLSLVWYLLAALAWLRFEERRDARNYAVATALFAAALLTKTVTASLPAALLVVAWWRRGRLDWRGEVLPLLPWFALSLGAGIVTAWTEHAFIGAQGADFSLVPAERALIAGRAVWFYAWTLLWPAGCTFIYPRWEIDAAAAWQWLFPLALAAAAGALAWLAWRRGRRGPLACLLLFGGSLFPALGFVDVYPFVFSFVADHFQYLASLGAIACLTAGVLRLASRLPRSAALALPPVLLAALGALTWAQAGIYRDLFTLYGATLARNPSCWMAHNNLASALVEAGRADEAIAHFREAIALRPNFAEAENNLGDALTRLGRPTEALEHLARANALQPRYPEARSNHGVALLSLGRSGEGIAQLEEALRLRPVFPVAHFNLGLAHARAGRLPEAIAHFEAAVRQKPDYAAAREALEQARREARR